MPLFCRHNRLTANCPICSRELGSEHNVKGSGRAGADAPAHAGERVDLAALARAW